jgi:hypothetical protein
MTYNRIICYILGHKIEKVGEKICDLPNGNKIHSIEIGCTRCGKRYKDNAPIYSSSDNSIQRFIRNRS